MTTAGVVLAVTVVVARLLIGPAPVGDVATVSPSEAPGSGSPPVTLAAAAAHRSDPVPGARGSSVGPDPWAWAAAIGTIPAPPAVETVIGPPPDRFDGPPPAPLPPPGIIGVDGPPAGGTWAVVLGVNDYPGRRSDLRGAVTDAEDMSSALRSLGVPAERVVTLLDGQVTRANVESALRWLARRAAPDATAVVYWAGHVRSLGGGTEAMVLADGSTVTDTELAGLLDGVRARQGWLVVAGCYGGGFGEAVREGWLLTAAAAPGRLAYESSTYGRSYLGEFLVRRALWAGAAPATATGATRWAVDELGRTHPDRNLWVLDRTVGPVPLAMGPRTPAPAAPPGGGDVPDRDGDPGGGGGDPSGAAPGPSGHRQEPSGPPEGSDPGDGRCANLNLVAVECHSR